MKQFTTTYPRIALVGRTNVGKSSLFNKLIGEEMALVSRIAGTTRDYREGECLWQGDIITVIDTAGLDVESQAEIDIESVKKSREAMKKASVIVFVVDGRDGLLPQDTKAARELQKLGKPILVAVNKVDSKKYLGKFNDFYSLGFPDVISMSAKSGSGVGDLLDKIWELLNLGKHDQPAQPGADEKEIKIAIIGKPNVGKSSLLNKIIGEDRAIVSALAHTTRDPQDVSVEYSVNDWIYKLTFIDTAGIIKHRKISGELDAESIDLSLQSMEKSDICLLVIDASQPITMQDKNISREILENNKSLIFVVNKWDLVPEKTTKSDKEYIRFLHGHFPFLTWAPIIFVSAKTGAKLDRLMDEVVQIYENQYQKITDKECADLLQHIIKKQAPRTTKGIKPPFIKTLRLVSNSPLTFEIYSTESELLHFSYRRFMINEIRARFNLQGVGIKLKLSGPQKKSHQTSARE